MQIADENTIHDGLLQVYVGTGDAMILNHWAELQCAVADILVDGRPYQNVARSLCFVGFIG